MDRLTMAFSPRPSIVLGSASFGGRVARLLAIAVAGMAAASCAEEPPAELPPPVASERSEPEAADDRATATLGDETFGLDRVFCVPGMVPTIVLSDSRERAGYPEIRLVDAGENETGRARDQASFDFREGEQRILWQLEAGDVVKAGDTVRASGTLRGRAMMEGADGNDAGTPLEGDDVVSFSVDATC